MFEPAKHDLRALSPNVKASTVIVLASRFVPRTKAIGPISQISMTRTTCDAVVSSSYPWGRTTTGAPACAMGVRAAGGGPGWSDLTAEHLQAERSVREGQLGGRRVHKKNSTEGPDSLPYHTLRLGGWVALILRSRPLGATPAMLATCLSQLSTIYVP